MVAKIASRQTEYAPDVDAPPRNAVKHFFRGNSLPFVAEVVRLRNRLRPNARILTNPATQILHSVAPARLVPRHAGKGEKLQSRKQ